MLQQLLLQRRALVGEADAQTLQIQMTAQQLQQLLQVAVTADGEVDPSHALAPQEQQETTQDPAAVAVAVTGQTPSQHMHHALLGSAGV